MGLLYKARTASMEERWYQIRFEEANEPEKMEMREMFLPPEWFPQSGAQLTWPHAGTDWHDMLPEVTDCYVRMAYEIASREPLLIVTPECKQVETLLREKLPSAVFGKIQWAECPTDDTWARDHGFITLVGENGPRLLDFQFNGWGGKFPAAQDNRINRKLMEQEILQGEYADCLDFVLEGGAIESDGLGTIMATSGCLLAPGRNEGMNLADIEEHLLRTLHAQRILWLDHGHLEGDDTDGHIDTLARFCPGQAIAYVRCTDKSDSHYEDLALMEEQLRSFRTLQDEPYQLVPLPMPDAIYDENGERLPATYANFFVVNGAVLMPTYNQPVNDEMAKKALQKAFPQHEVVGIDCRVLIRQHGSLHCSTMQFPSSVLKPIHK